MRRNVTVRLLKKGQEDDGAFDFEFWRQQGPAAIFGAAQQMLEEVSHFRQGAPDGELSQPGLSRHVVRIVRRRS